MIRTVFAIAATLALAALLGCGGTIPESRYYILDYTVEEEEGEHPLDMILGVDVFGARPLYRDRRLAYRVSDHEVAYYPYRYWAADPGDLIASQLADRLRDRRVALVVLEQPFDLTPDWVISGRVQRFEEVDRGDRWFAVCELTVRIEDPAGRRVVAEEVLHREIATTERTPEAVAAAMSVAVREIGGEVEAIIRRAAEEI